MAVGGIIDIDAVGATLDGLFAELDQMNRKVSAELTATARVDRSGRRDKSYWTNGSAKG